MLVGSITGVMVLLPAMLNPTARTRGYIYSIYIHPDPPDLGTPGVDGSTPYTPPEVFPPYYITLRDTLQGA